jgi:hypothetical protein
MDIYAIVTEKIIKLHEQGIVPWRKPWTSAGLPRNLFSKKTISRRERVFAFCVKVHFAILVDNAPLV